VIGREPVFPRLYINLLTGYPSLVTMTEWRDSEPCRAYKLAEGQSSLNTCYRIAALILSVAWLPWWSHWGVQFIMKNPDLFGTPNHN